MEKELQQIIVLRNEQESRIIKCDDLVIIEINDYLSTFVLSDGKKFHCSKTLKELDKILSCKFFRINRRVIVNLEKVIAADFQNRTVLLINNLAYTVSCRRWKEFKESAL